MTTTRLQEKHIWLAVSCGIGLLVLIPLLVILAALFQDSADIWPHLYNHVLGDVILNTFWLVLGVAAGAVCLGVSLAWLTTFCEFPGRRFFAWTLMLPLAIPTYVLGFVWIGILDFSGPVASTFRSMGGASFYDWIQIRSRGGVIFVMILALYPYVYLLAKNAFQTQGRSVIEAARSLGYHSWDVFFRVSIPAARPWIAGGLLLVVMESLADFGTVSIFNYDTFTTAIYKTWYGLFSLTAAAQLSSILLLIVFCLLLAETHFRGRKGYAAGASHHSKVKRYQLHGLKAWAVFTFPLVVFALGFIIPVTQLLFWCMKSFKQELDIRYLGFLFHTILIAILAASVICFLAMILSYTKRRIPGWGMQWVTKVATLGYAMPGTVLAVGVFSSFVMIDRSFVNGFRNVFQLEIGMIFTGTIVAMLMAYVVRFLAVGFTPIDSAVQRLTQHVEEAAVHFGYRGLEYLRKIQIPMIKGGVLTAGLLVFVDVMKEMPITLMTRPFGWDTLAVRIFEMTSEGEWERAALPAVCLVLIGFIPVVLLTKQKESVHV